MHKTAVIEHSFDQLSVGYHIEYEFVAKKGKVQLWCGVVVSTDPDADCHADLVSDEPEITSKRVRYRHTTTKGASCLNAADSDKADCHTAASLPKASGRSVTAVRHYRVLGQNRNVVGGASVCS